MRALVPITFYFCTSLNAQTTFAPPGATWTYKTTIGQPPWNGSYGTYTVSVIGDTTIDDKVCSIINFPVGTDCGFPDVSTSQRNVFIHVEGDSVTWYNALSGEFNLIMDLGALPGSQWSVPLHQSLEPPYGLDTITYLIQAVDTVWYNGEALRRLHYLQEGSTGVFQTGGTELIERLGDMTYMFPWRTCVDGTYEGPLLCYSDPAFNWPDPGVNCAMWLGTKEEARVGTLTISPTVVQSGGSFAVQCPRSFEGPVSLIVLDALGRRIAEHPITNDRADFTIDRSGAFTLLVLSKSSPLARQRVVVL